MPLGNSVSADAGIKRAKPQEGLWHKPDLPVSVTLPGFLNQDVIDRSTAATSCQQIASASGIEMVRPHLLRTSGTPAAHFRTSHVSATRPQASRLLRLGDDLTGRGAYFFSCSFLAFLSSAKSMTVTLPSRSAVKRTTKVPTLRSAGFLAGLRQG